MFAEVAKVSDIAPGGLIAVEAGGDEIVLGNYDGKIYAISRRCGHMNAPLEMGTLDGYIVTCPLHYAQFDLTTGEALSPPVGRGPGGAAVQGGPISVFQKQRAALVEHIKTCDIKTFPVRIDGDVIEVDV